MAPRCPSIGLGIVTLMFLTAGTAFADKICYCRTSTGDRVEVGKTSCLKTNSGFQEARCGYVLNNTAWKFTGKSCPLAGRGRGQEMKSALAMVRGR